MKILNFILFSSLCLGIIFGEEIQSDVNVHPNSLSESEGAETHQYQAEVTRLMDIIINSLYTQKEVFLRELISNAVDALEKVRFLSINDSEILQRLEALEIRISYDAELKTLEIADTGIGMSKEDLINNLGTVAKSGTSNFLESLVSQIGNDINLIGQFGVGFYSAFLVADKVTVISRKINHDQYIWESSADAKYYISKDPRGNTMERGTRIILHFKDDSTELLNQQKLEELINRYSQFMSFPIYLKHIKIEHVEAEEAEAEADVDKKKDEDSIEIQDGEPNKNKNKIEKKVISWDQVNKQKAIWLRPKEQITDEEYKEFYKSISKDWSDPLNWMHFSAEGEIEFKALLYIPKRQPSDIFNNYFGKQTSLKLYVRRVLVTDTFEDLLPKYLHFIRGVVDSDDLPLNVSREQLQQHKLLNIMSKKLVRKTLETIRKMYLDGVKVKSDLLEQLKTHQGDPEEYKRIEAEYKSPNEFMKFYTEFSRNLMLGCYEDDTNRNKIAKVLLFPTSTTEEPIALEEYIRHMPTSQTSIFYAAGESKEQISKLPQMQIFKKKNIQVLYLLDSMDEPCIQRLVNFEGKKFESIQKGDITLDETEEERSLFKRTKKYYEPLLKWWKNQLNNRIQKVEISRRLVDAPCAVVASQWGYSGQMEKIMKTQTFADPMHMKMMAGQKVFEINPHHKVIQYFMEKLKKGGENEMSFEDKQSAVLLFEAALLSSGFEVEKPTDLAALLYKSVSKEIGVDVDNVINSNLELPEITAEDDAASMDSDDHMSGDIPQGLNMEEILKSVNITPDVEKDEL